LCVSSLKQETFDGSTHSVTAANLCIFPEHRT
jgi:hypothetical protein